MEIGRVFFFLLFFFSYNPPPDFFCPRAKCTGRKLRERDGKLKTLFASKLSQFGEKGGGKEKKRVKKTLLPSSIFFPGRREMEVGVVVRVRPPKETKPSRKSCTVLPQLSLTLSLSLPRTSQYEGWSSKERGRQKKFLLF